LFLLGCLLCGQVFAYDHSVSGVLVGSVRVFGSFGLAAMTRADGGAFTGCVNDSTTMWADESFLTTDGAKALLATLLSAKASGSPVTIYYTTADGYCRMQIIQIDS
jgi:hypothetical protein